MPGKGMCHGFMSKMAVLLATQAKVQHIARPFDGR
jgi:hypothetical protein